MFKYPEMEIAEWYSVPFGWRSVFIILFCVVVFFAIRSLFRKFFGKWIFKLKNRELKYKKFWTVIFLFHMGVALYQSTLSSLVKIFDTYKIGFLIIMVTVIAAIGLAVWSYRKYQQQIRQEHEFLNMKQDLMVLHMKAIRQQILDMEHEQKIIDQQMEKIKQMDEIKKESNQIKNYLKTLKNQYRRIQAGMYTDDVFVDSVLYYYANIFKRQEVPLEVSFAKYQKGSLDEMCAGKVLMYLLESALTNGQRKGQKYTVRLYGGTVKNQVLFLMECGIAARTGEKKLLLNRRRAKDFGHKKTLKALKKYVKQHSGKSHMIRNKDQMKLEIILTGIHKKCDVIKYK